jgi:phage tail sheath protein FI
MFHADAPRQLVLNGNLSLIDDLRKNPEEVFKAAKLQKLAIKNSTYMETNTQWYEIFNNFNYTKMWAPSSIFLAGNITRNDIQGNIWDAPAGHKYGVVTNVYRPAFNPSFEVQDVLYLQCLNYGVAWPTGIITIEGQKTNYGEKSALNRINVRRLMIWMERYAQDQSAQFIYEPNNQITRDNYKAVLDLEYSRIKALGGITDYQVVCSAEENNPPPVVDDNEMRVTIKVIPTRTTEYILANFVICKTGTNLEEVSSMF